MPFKPGQSGNPLGTPKLKPFLDAVNRAIAQDDAKRLRAAAEKLLTLASEGTQWAVEMLADRLDGRPMQQTEISGPEGGPIGIAQIERRIVDPADTNAPGV